MSVHGLCSQTIAFFWVCDVWIPMLERNNLCPKFDYILMTDDDVCLPPGIQATACLYFRCVPTHLAGALDRSFHSK